MPQRVRAVLVVSAIAFAVVAPRLVAQAVEQSSPAFDVASVKPNTSGPTAPARVVLQAGTNRVSIVNEPLRLLIQVAYPEIPEIVGGPAWLGKAGPNLGVPRFDVDARAEEPSSDAQLRAMLRTLIADRFHLIAHIEARETPVYALGVARADGRLGPGLRPEARDCESLRAKVRGQPGAADPCRVIGKEAAGHLSARSKTIDLLASLLRPLVDRPIVNKTGLTGSYDWDFTFLPPSTRVSDGAQSLVLDSNGPSVFTALRDQLGLKLVAEKDEQSTLVVDHVEQPTPD
jgi:uncharacterized protein (TIGR03435 family)